MPLEAAGGYLLAVLPLLSWVQDTEGSKSGSSRQQEQHHQHQHHQHQQHSICEPNREFWSAERGSCWPCTVCAPQFTLSPCALHKDAICGPLSALELDWSFLSTGGSKRREPGDRRSVEAAKLTTKMLWRFPEFQDDPRDHRELATSDPAASDLPFIRQDDRGAPIRRSHDPRDRRKTVAEDRVILWDWQTGALVLAVCACILFFLVAGCSALVYARQWRRIKRNFEPAGLEEISARLNLMVKAELAELVAGAPMNPGDPETRCQYLEKLLDRRRGETPVVIGWPEIGGNLYIEEGEPSKASRNIQIAQIHRNFESLLSQKKSSPV